MKTGLVNFRIAPAMNDGSVIVRRAAKDWMCWGGHDGTKRTKCRFGQIVKGQVYVEYVGEVPAFTSGARYHPSCAAQQGLLERIPHVDVRGNPPQYQQGITPGEWAVTGSRDDDEGLFVVQKSTGGIIASIESTFGYGTADEANARLIAGAPDMFQALTLLARNYCPSCGCDKANTEGCDWCNCMRIGRTALKKAAD